jgi:hypothetical protein
LNSPFMSYNVFLISFGCLFIQLFICILFVLI